MQHYPPAYIADRSVVESRPYPAQEVGRRVAIIIGESQDLSARRPYCSIQAVGLAQPRLKQVDGSDVSRALDKVSHDGSCLVGRSIVRDNQFPRSFKCDAPHGFKAAGELLMTIPRANDQRYIHLADD